MPNRNPNSCLLSIVQTNQPRKDLYQVIGDICEANGYRGDIFPRAQGGIVVLLLNEYDEGVTREEVDRIAQRITVLMRSEVLVEQYESAIRIWKKERST